MSVMLLRIEHPCSDVMSLPLGTATLPVWFRQERFSFHSIKAGAEVWCGDDSIALYIVSAKSNQSCSVETPWRKDGGRESLGRRPFSAATTPNFAIGLINGASKRLELKNLYMSVSV